MSMVSVRSSVQALFWLSGVGAVLAGCVRGDPPGYERNEAVPRLAPSVVASGSASAPTRPLSSSAAAVEPGASASSSAMAADSVQEPSASASASASAQVPAAPVLGEKRLYSTAIETLVRATPSQRARQLGYLRAGSSVRRSDEPVGNDGCKGGWYAIEPEGFVCVGESATLDEHAKMLRYAQPLPARGKPMPFQYAKLSSTPVIYYSRLPSPEDQRELEGSDVLSRISGGGGADPHLSLLGEPIEPPPELLAGEGIPRPPGAEPRLRFRVHTGRAEPNSRFALLSHFKAGGRRFAITSQLDLIALDRVRLMKASDFHGIELHDGELLPVGFVRGRGGAAGVRPEGGQPVHLGFRQAVRLTGQEKRQNGGRLLETSEGFWVAESALLIVPARDRVPPFVRGDDYRWIDVSIKNQTLVAYRGRKPVYVTMVSTGSGNLGDPETTHATPRGVFTIYSKHISTKMSGDEIGREFMIDDVPYVQYFHKGYALHGAFWHDDFGHVYSHGCVNLAPADAAWLFEFTGPEVPQGWHGVAVRTGGTTLLIQP